MELSTSKKKWVLLGAVFVIVIGVSAYFIFFGGFNPRGNLTALDYTEYEPTVVHTDEEWQALLTDIQYHVLREKGTEQAYTGDTWNNDVAGVYHCAGCDTPLFSSETKYKAGTGWPSFYAPITNSTSGLEDGFKGSNIGHRTDMSAEMSRVEVYCRTCSGHLGHVFPDGPEPTGLRYCLNSAALVFLAD